MLVPGMKPIPFFSTLDAESRQRGTLLCVGLDPALDIPAAEVLPRMAAIVDATKDSALAFKPNSAFFEARGPAGMEALAALIRHIHAAGRLAVLDAKRGDISSTADAYAQAAFDVLGADAITASPLLGGDSVESLARRDDRGVFLLCHTSNPGARDLQELDVGGVPFYVRVAEAARVWNTRGNVGLVVGATFPEQLARVRAAAPRAWILLPGIGAQGGDLEASLAAGLDADGGRVLVNVSRAVCQAADPRAAAAEYCTRIAAAREAARRAPRPAAAPRTALDEIALGLHDLGAVRFGSFTLKSGKSSPVYIDLRLLVSGPAVMARAAAAMAGLMAGLRFDRIAALPYGGLPIGQAVSLASGRPMIYPRREAKDYGTKKLIEGAFAAGETAIVLDDLVTTGASKMEALAPLTDAGLTVRDVVVLVDRQQGGREELAARGITLHAVLTVSDLLDSLVRHGRITDAVRRDVRAALGIA
jgi:uridine monophosphate synthetase